MSQALPLNDLRFYRGMATSPRVLDVTLWRKTENMFCSSVILLILIGLIGLFPSWVFSLKKRFYNGFIIIILSITLFLLQNFGLHKKLKMPISFMEKYGIPLTLVNRLRTLSSLWKNLVKVHTSHPPRLVSWGPLQSSLSWILMEVLTMRVLVMVY